MALCLHGWVDEDGCAESCDGPQEIAGYCEMHAEFHGEEMVDEIAKLRAELEEARRERDEARSVADQDPCVLRDRCPSCGHRLRPDLLSTACPQCEHRFRHDWHYNLDADWPEDCSCDRCAAARAEGRES